MHSEMHSRTHDRKLGSGSYDEREEPQEPIPLLTHRSAHRRLLGFFDVLRIPYQFPSRILGLELNPNLNNKLKTNRDLTPK